MLSEAADGFGEAGKKLVADFEAIVKEIHSSLAGATFDRHGTRRDSRSMSVIVKSTPASNAAASR